VLFSLANGLRRVVATGNLPLIEHGADGFKKAAVQAHALMESLFAWVRLQMDTMTISLVDVDLEEIARSTARDAAEAAAEKSVSLFVDCSGIQVRAHPDMLATVLRNLVGNAIKFSLPGGEIAITARPGGEFVEIEVTDTGVGMPPHQVSNLFKLDQRTSTKGTADEPGSGFGLLVCRDLVERLGAELTVRSAVNHGTTFRFLLAGILVSTESLVA
jgi:two-component system sensor histidine kinase/response regulator